MAIIVQRVNDYTVNVSVSHTQILIFIAKSVVVYYLDLYHQQEINYVIALLLLKCQIKLIYKAGSVQDVTGFIRLTQLSVGVHLQ